MSSQSKYLILIGVLFLAVCLFAVRGFRQLDRMQRDCQKYGLVLSTNTAVGGVACVADSLAKAGLRHRLPARLRIKPALRLPRKAV